MRFHGLLLVRDEQDIIVQNLNHLLTWADAVYVLDLGSTDGTWEVVKEFASRDKRIVPVDHAAYVFGDTLRGYLFDKVRDRFENGDWVLRVDSDEFYHIKPLDFVQQRLGKWETAVLLQWYYFRLTRSEVADYESGKIDLFEDRKRPIEDRRRYYKISEYAEPRMFKYRRGIKWPCNANAPFHAGFVARERIPIRHYPHRDPLQMQTRFGLRAAMMDLNAVAGSHWKLSNWRAEIVDENGVSASSIGNKQGIAGEAGIDTGSLHYWTPGTPLQEVPIYSHAVPSVQRIAQRIMHPFLLPILDSMRQSFDRAHTPPTVPDQIEKSLKLKADISPD